ncbi:MAG TPA: hypothetical protein VFW44_13180, partial [Bryobacteraceae bacterium]|nr:hypothetical protein [Bryobacteraceae bacterium]
QGDDAIYAVPQNSASLAHVIDPSAVVVRPPANGLDVAALEPYVQAIERPDAPPAELQWRDSHEARIRSILKPEQLLSVQLSYDPHWRARVDGVERKVSPDALGMVIVAPRCNGACSVELSFEEPSKLRWLFLQIPLWIACIVLFQAAIARRSRQEISAATKN